MQKWRSDTYRKVFSLGAPVSNQSNERVNGCSTTFLSLCVDFQEAFQKVPLTDSILSLLCDDSTDSRMLTIQEVSKLCIRAVFT